jgi:hypothetical protein
MSQPQIAASLGWDSRTAKAALAALLDSGLLVRMLEENAYRVLAHSDLVLAGEQCWEGADDGRSRSTPTSNSQIVCHCVFSCVCRFVWCAATLHQRTLNGSRICMHVVASSKRS